MSPPATAFSIEADAGGSWAANVYTSAKAGTWTVTGIYLGLTDTASLTVNAGALHNLTVTSDNYTQQVTVSFTVTVTAYDAFDNLVTADNVTLTMSSTPSVLIFDGNANGTYGETGDDVGVLMSGTLDIPGKGQECFRQSHHLGDRWHHHRHECLLRHQGLPLLHRHRRLRDAHD